MTRASGAAHSLAAAVRRYRAVAGSLLLLAAVFALLAGLDYAARRDTAGRDADRAIAVGREYLAQALDPYRRMLSRLAVAPMQDMTERATLQNLLDIAPALAAGVRGAAVVDPAGTLIQAGAGLSASTMSAVVADTLASLEDDSATALHVGRQIPDDAPGADLLVLMQTRHDLDGHDAGFAVLAVDAGAFEIAARLPPSLAAGRFELVRQQDAAKPGPVTADVRETRIAGFPMVLRYTYPDDAVVRGWRDTWLRNGVLMALVAAAVAIGVALRQRRRRRLATLRAERRRAEDAGLRRHLSELAAAARRADEANRSKSRFFAQVTHELRTPLNAVLGFSEVIRAEMFGPVGNPRYLEYAGLINDAGAHLLSLIDDLLDMAKLEAGKMEIAPIRVSAAALARSVLDLFELTAKQRDIALSCGGVETCPDLYVDLRAAKQVLINLLSNALKFTPPGGRIELSFARRHDGAVVITIADSGSGMSEEDLRIAFEPFGRSASARRQPGTGLGLPLARALAELHRGELSLASEPGRGTRAMVIFPPEGTQTQPQAHAQGGPAREARSVPALAQLPLEAANAA